MFDQFFHEEAAWFGVPALLGSAIFLIRLILMLIAGDGDADLGDDGSAFAGDDGDSSDSFEILSIQGLAAFGMGFGWAGLGALNGAGWSTGTAITLGVAGGAGMVWLLALLLRGVHDLQSSGTVNMQGAVGTIASVYATVPEHKSGRGKVRVVIKNRERILNAITEGDALPTGTQVRVLTVDDTSTATVTSA
ncbi:MAG: hypothetical protein DHS20C15_30990 [Planctomycetota bacterium]|nr:MAG: hypothetical protein DHS20C15_30990 [Planctomycetota bacterium]